MNKNFMEEHIMGFTDPKYCHLAQKLAKKLRKCEIIPKHIRETVHVSGFAVYATVDEKWYEFMNGYGWAIWDSNKKKEV